MKLLYLLPIFTLTQAEETENYFDRNWSRNTWCDRFEDVYQNLNFSRLIPVDDQFYRYHGQVVWAKCDRGYATVFNEVGPHRRSTWEYEFRHPFKCNNGTWEHDWGFQDGVDFTCQLAPCYPGVKGLGLTKVITSWNEGKSYLVEYSLNRHFFNRWIQPHGTDTDLSEGWTVSLELETPITTGRVSGINTEHVNVNLQGNFVSFHSIPGVSDDLWHEAGESFQVILKFEDVDVDQSQFRALQSRFYFKRYQNVNCVLDLPDRVLEKPEQTMVFWNGEPVDSNLVVPAACDPDADNFCHADHF